MEVKKQIGIDYNENNLIGCNIGSSSTQIFRLNNSPEIILASYEVI